MIAIVCPSCAARGKAGAAAVGAEVRCKHCGHRFRVPPPGASEPEVYDVNEPEAPVAAAASPVALSDRAGGSGSVFVSSRGDVSASSVSRRPPRTSARKRRRDEPGVPWGTWLLGAGAVAVVALAAVALFVPDGVVIVGQVLLALGSLMVLAGWSAGAYGAFREDFLHGALYVAVPLYTGYYIVTRWDDLWPWFTCSTLGVGLVYLGTALVL